MRLKQFLIPAFLLKGPVKNILVKNLFPNLLETNQNLLNLGVDKDNKSDSIQYVPILSTLKVLLEHEDVLESVLDQGNDNEGNGKLRTFKDGTAKRMNELFSLDKNSL